MEIIFDFYEPNWKDCIDTAYQGGTSLSYSWIFGLWLSSRLKYHLGWWALYRSSCYQGEDQGSHTATRYPCLSSGDCGTAANKRREAGVRICGEACHPQEIQDNLSSHAVPGSECEEVYP